MSKAWEVADLFLNIRKATLNDPTGKEGEYYPSVSSEASIIATETETIQNNMSEPKTLKEAKDQIHGYKDKLAKVILRTRLLAKNPPRMSKRVMFHREGPIMAINLANMRCKIINTDDTEIITTTTLRYRDALESDEIREIIEHMQRRKRLKQSDYGVLSMINKGQETFLAIAGPNGARNLFPFRIISVYLDDASGTLVIRKIKPREQPQQQGPVQEEEASTLFEGSPETQGPTKNQKNQPDNPEEPLPEEMP